MTPFGKERLAGTKAGQSLRSPEVMDWKREKASTVAATDSDNDFSLTCYGGGSADAGPFRRKANLLEELFSKLQQTVHCGIAPFTLLTGSFDGRRP